MFVRSAQRPRVPNYHVVAVSIQNSILRFIFDSLSLRIFLDLSSRAPATWTPPDSSKKSCRGIYAQHPAGIHENLMKLAELGRGTDDTSNTTHSFSLTASLLGLLLLRQDTRAPKKSNCVRLACKIYRKTNIYVAHLWDVWAMDDTSSGMYSGGKFLKSFITSLGISRRHYFLFQTNSPSYEYRCICMRFVVNKTCKRNIGKKVLCCLMKKLDYFKLLDISETDNF